MAILEELFANFILHLIHEQKVSLCWPVVVLIVICGFQLHAPESKPLNIQAHKQHVHKQTKLTEGSHVCHHHLEGMAILFLNKLR